MKNSSCCNINRSSGSIKTRTGNCARRSNFTSGVCHSEYSTISRNPTIKCSCTSNSKSRQCANSCNASIRTASEISIENSSISNCSSINGGIRQFTGCYRISRQISCCNSSIKNIPRNNGFISNFR